MATPTEKKLVKELDAAEAKYLPDAPRKPYVGAIVALVDPDGNKDTHPAMVTRLGANMFVTLTVFAAGVTPYSLRAAAPYSAEGVERGTWHWFPEN